MSPKPTRPRRHARKLCLAPLIAIGAVVASNAGLTVISSAGAATDSIAVTAEVASTVSVNDGCGGANTGALRLSAAPNASGTAPTGTTMLTASSMNYGWCDVTFSSNSANTLLKAHDVAGASAFFSTNPSGFTEESLTTCDSAGSLGANEVGFKVASGAGGTAAANNHCPVSPTTAATNEDYTKFNDNATPTVCTGATASTTYTCRVAVAINVGASPTAGVNTGSITLTV